RTRREGSGYCPGIRREPAGRTSVVSNGGRGKRLGQNRSGRGSRLGFGKRNRPDPNVPNGIKIVGHVYFASSDVRTDPANGRLAAGPARRQRTRHLAAECASPGPCEEGC